MSDRHDKAYDIRIKSAKIAKDRDHPNQHETNGEEKKYKDSEGHLNYIGNFTKGLKHHLSNNRDAGEVESEDYRKLVDALRSEKPSEFERLPLGGTEKFTNPQAGFAFDLEGPDSHDLIIKKAPALDSVEAAGEMAELYWMALSRDVLFNEFSSDTIIGKAVADLNSNYDGFPVTPKVEQGGFRKVIITRDTVFRGMTEGDLVGPYISQFLILPIPWGSQKLEQKQRPLMEKDYITNYRDWLRIQNGEITDDDKKIEYSSSDGDKPVCQQSRRYILTPRDLTYYVHVDQLYQAYLGACLIILNDNFNGKIKDKEKFDSGLPLRDSKTQIGFGTFGGPHILSLVTEVASRALKAVWFQKWAVHRRLRPEAFAGLLHREKDANPSLTPPNPHYKFHSSLMDSAVLEEVFIHNKEQNTKYGRKEDDGRIDGSYLLPEAFGEGSPLHPSYGAGHATVAGACTTILKTWFNEDYKIDKPKQVSDDGTELVDYAGSDKDKITIGGELNKVAANIAIGRNWGGVHYRSDYTESLLLGERVAIGILQEQAVSYHEDEPFSCTLTKFDGSKIKFKGSRLILNGP